jgi:hypothetical protein
MIIPCLLKKITMVGRPQAVPQDPAYDAPQVGIGFYPNAKPRPVRVTFSSHPGKEALGLLTKFVGEEGLDCGPLLVDPVVEAGQGRDDLRDRRLSKRPHVYELQLALGQDRELIIARLKKWLGILT